MDDRLIFLYFLNGVMEGRSMLNESVICRSKVVGRQGLNDLTLSLKTDGTVSLRVSWIHDALLTRKAPKR